MKGKAWPVVTIGQIASPGKNALVGGPFGSDLVSRDYVEHGVPVIRGANMGSGRWIGGDFVFVSAQKADSLSANCAKPGDLVFTQRGTIGQVALVPENGPERYLISQSQMKLTVDPAKADHIFLFYVFCTEEHQNYIQQNAIRTGVPHTNLSILRGTPVRLPSLQDQKAIAAVLSALDAKIELNNRINEELEGMAKLLYDYWFVQYDFPISAAQAAAMGKPHLESKPYRASGGKLTHNETLNREIPDGWTVKPLFDAMAVQYGFPFSTTQFTTEPTDIPVVRIRDILANTISLYTTEHVDSRYELLPNDLVIGMDGNFHMNFWDKAGCYLNQRSVRIRARANSSISTFQAYFEMSPYIKAREKNVSRTTVGHLSDKDLKRLYLLEPASGNEFGQRQVFDSMLTKITHARAENQALTALRDWLLPMLMNGQVSVG